MKFTLKAAALLALIIGGKLSQPTRPAALAVRSKRPVITEAIFVNQRRPAPVTVSSPRRSEPVQAQVLSVFFK